MLAELLEFNNIDMEMVESYLKDEILADLEKRHYDFYTIFSSLLTGRYDCFNGIDLLYFKIIMNKCSEDIKDKFMDFVFSILVNNHELDLNDVKILKDMLKHKISTNSISFWNINVYLQVQVFLIQFSI